VQRELFFCNFFEYMREQLQHFSHAVGAIFVQSIDADVFFSTVVINGLLRR
jgi:hypothetical protein